MGNEQQLDMIFYALSDKTRRSLLSRITTGPKRVTQLAAGYDMSLNAVSKHLKILERAKLMTRKVEGRVHYCLLDANELNTAKKWLMQYEQFWNDKLDSLEKFILTKNKSHNNKGDNDE